MRIIATSNFVDDQDKAQQFYTEKLGLKTKHNIEIGGGFRWVTVTEKDSTNPVEIVLEPNVSPISTDYMRQGFLSQCSAWITWMVNIKH